jgi:hypothetical protein
MNTNGALLPTDLFLLSYEANFLQGILRENEKKLTRSFNLACRYVYKM